MSLFKGIINFWRADDLLSQAWKDSYEMLNLSRKMFAQAIKLLREQNNLQVIEALKKPDEEINEYQRNVRK